MVVEDKFADEIMSDEELDQVAGGNISGTSDDSYFLYQHGLMNTWHYSSTVFGNWIKYSAEVDGGWSNAGITCVTDFIEANRYFAGQKEITREEAMKIVEKKFPKIRD